MDTTALETSLASTDHESKVDALHALQQALLDGPQMTDGLADQLTTLLTTGLHAPNAHVTFSALSCLPHYFPLLVPAPEQPPSASRPDSPSSASSSRLTLHSAATALRHACMALVMMERMGDGKEKTREVVRDGVVAAGRAALKLGAGAAATGKEKESAWSWLMRGMMEVFTSKNAKAREQVLHCLLALRNPELTHPLAPLRPFTPSLLSLLSDSDPAVRSLALSSTISIFSSPSVSEVARTDLKKELARMEVGKKVQDTILGAILGTGAVEGSVGSLGSDGGKERRRSVVSPASSPSKSSGIPRSIITQPQPLVAPVPSTDPTAGSTSDVSPVYITSERDLLHEFDEMKEGFEGKETEFNWMVRDKSIVRIRGMLKGGVQERFLEGFLGGLKGVQDGIFKTASSLRTTLATSTLSLMSELSNTLGHAFDPFLPDYLSHTLSMAGQTKKLVATASQSAVTALLTNSAYHLKTIQLLWTGMNDKIVLARTFVSAHLLTFVQIHGKKSRASIESSGGWDVVELCLKKGLADSNSVVKENCRKTYWEVAQVHEATSKKVWEGLDAQSRKALEKVEPGKGKEEGEPEKGKVARPSVRQMMAAKARASLQPAQVVDTLDGSPQQRSRTVSAPFPSTSPIATRPTTKLQGELDTLAGPTNASSDLLGLAPPFALADDKDPSLAFSSTSTPSRSRNHALVLPVTEPIVDDALRDQASQAEQAAERLLELAEDEQSHAADEAEGATTPLPLFQRTPVTKRTVHLNGFEDSPDVRDSGFAGTGRGNWWMKQQPGRTATSASLVETDSPERTAEIAALFTSLASRTITADGLRQLSALSNDRPLQDEDDASSEANEAATLFWEGGRLVVRTFDDLDMFLRDVWAEDRRDLALVLLRDLLQNQFVAFSGDEYRIHSVLLRLRQDSSRTTVAAVEGIAEVFCAQLEPVYGLGALRSSLTTFLDQAPSTTVASAFALGLRLMGRYFSRLPMEVLEDELPKAKDLIQTGLNDAQSGDLRRAAVMTLVAAQCVVKDEEKLYIMIDGLSQDQRSLLSYYYSRAQ